MLRGPSEQFRTYGNVFVNKKGLSDAEEKCLIYYDRERSGLASLYRRDLRHYNIELSKSEEIETICAGGLHRSKADPAYRLSEN